MCQVKHDLMMLWVPPVRRRCKALKVKQRAIAKAARGLFPEKGVNIEEISVSVSRPPRPSHCNGGTASACPFTPLCRVSGSLS